MSNDKVIREGMYRVGTKQTIKAVEQNKAALVYVARDTDPKLMNKVIAACKKHGVEIHYVDTMKQLGKACGIEVGAAMAALVK